jgi:hypothetical protein
MTSIIANAAGPPKSLKKLFVPPVSEKCTRCNQRVYQVEKVGPVNEVIFHRQCFKCCQCDQHLSLKSYFTNQADYVDKEIYCAKHCPKISAHGYDGRAMGIRSATSVPGKGPQLNAQVRGGGDGAPRIGADAMHIRGAMWAQSNYQRKYITKYDKHHFPAYLVSKTKEKLYKYQEDLERLQREEEDRLMAEFHTERRHEAENMEKELNNEWEVQLKDLTNRYETKRGSKPQANTTEHYEEAKEELKKTMTVKMQKKKDALSLRLQSEAQLKTATLVKKHSQQMLELLHSKQDELKKELEDEIKASVREGEGGEETDEMLEEAMAAISIPTELPDPHAPKIRKRDLYTDPVVFKELDEDVFKVAESEQCTFTELVKQLTEHCLSDLQKARAIFRWITVKDLNVMEFDESVKQDTPMGLLRGIKYGTETYHTLFIRLCSYAGLNCMEVKGHSKSVGYEPGMKIRDDTFQNTWNVVLILGDWWPVQCNWGARHLVLNKDIQELTSKAKPKTDKIRYQYDEHYFLTDPDEFIQEFWAKDPDWQLLERPVTLEQFEAMPFVRSVFFHYGLEFSQPMKAQLSTDSKGGVEIKLIVPEDLADDLVFHYQLRFADRERRNDVEFRGSKMERFVFHSVSDCVALFSVHIPTPASYFFEIFSNKIDESNKISDDPNATMLPFRLKCAAKFKIICEELVGKMHPLPACASGEWGPSKGRRHFGLVPLTHALGVINVEDEVEVRFKMPRPLHCLSKLKYNSIEDKALERFVSHSVHDGTLTVRAVLPMAGQFGLDIYARPEDAANSHTFAHACKYLLNCTRVTNPVDIAKLSPSINNNDVSLKLDTNGSRSPASPTSSIRSPSLSPTPQGALGPLPPMESLGIKPLSHKDPLIDRLDKSGGVVIEMSKTDPNIRLVAKLTSEADHATTKVSVKEGSSKVKIAVVLPRHGEYRLGVFAGRRDESENIAVNVMNYRVVWVDDSTMGGSKKKKGLFKS